MNKPTNRKEEITKKFLSFLDIHIDNIITGKEQDFLGIGEIAKHLALSHQHLTDTIKSTLGNHPCHYYDEKLIEAAKHLLINEDMTPAAVARKLTYDPSNFSKFFKKWTGETPGAYKEKADNDKPLLAS